MSEQSKKAGSLLKTALSLRNAGNSATSLSESAEPAKEVKTEVVEAHDANKADSKSKADKKEKNGKPAAIKPKNKKVVKKDVAEIKPEEAEELIRLEEVNVSEVPVIEKKEEAKEPAKENTAATAKTGVGMSFSQKAESLASLEGEPPLHLVSTHKEELKNKETKITNLSMPTCFRSLVEELAKENERPLSFIMELLLEYALEVNPMKEFPAAIGLPMGETWDTIFTMPISMHNRITKLADEHTRPLKFAVNALMKYTLIKIGKLDVNNK